MIIFLTDVNLILKSPFRIIDELSDCVLLPLKLTLSFFLFQTFIERPGIMYKQSAFGRQKLYQCIKMCLVTTLGQPRSCDT